MKTITVLSLLLAFCVPCVASASLADHPEPYDANYSYQPAERRDPFVPMILQNHPHAANVLTVGESILVGITRDSQGSSVLLKSADGRVHTLRVGDKLEDGEVLRIEAERVVFRQILPPGQILREKEVVKSLHPEE